jgi:hypothetical protein
MTKIVYDSDWSNGRVTYDRPPPVAATQSRKLKTQLGISIVIFVTD